VIFTINVDRRGHLWFGASGGASGLAEGVWRHFTTADGLPHQVVHSALQDHTGTVWFACRQGLAYFADGKMQVRYPEVNFGSIVEDRAGHLWFGTRTRGVYQFNGERWAEHLPGRDVRPMSIDSEGRIWAVSDDAGVYLYDGATWHSYGIDDGLASDTVYDVVQVEEGSLWFATAQGASRYRS
jgi:ligand-binding sensor domain-containing protein